MTTKHGDWITYDRAYPRPLRSVYIDENVKTTLLKDLKGFIDNEKEYQRYGIPYKRNYLITGIPGSGKTSLIKAVCGELDFDVSVLTVETEMSNHNLIYAMSHLPSKSVLVIEDIDCIFNKRSTTKDSASFNFSTLLNILDGTLSCSGLIVFVTTNHPQELDAAFVRQGRMDLILQINYPKKKEIKRLFYDMNENNPVYDTIEKKKDAFESFYEEIAGNDITMAAIVNFLFKNRGLDYRNNISDLLDTDKYIKEIMNETNLKEGRLYA
jgi:chaperone BCS1